MSSLPRTFAFLLAALALSGQALAGVPPGTPSLTSTKYPIRIWYDANATEQLAQQALTVAEQTWEQQITGMGFAIPLRTVDGAANAEVEQGCDLFLTKAPEGASATFTVLGDHAATPETDCPVVGIIDAKYVAGNVAELTDLVGHLMNHASLHAVDCIEPQMPIFDLVSMAVLDIEGTAYAGFASKGLASFQGHPQWSFDAFPPNSATSSLWYPFGTFLFGLYLEERYGARDGKLLVEMWKGTPQPGHITGVFSLNPEVCYADVDNAPTYLDAMSAMLKAKGTTFDEAFTGFSEWRVFTGSQDDGKHFQKAATYPKVTPMMEYGQADLPVSWSSDAVMRYGVGYVTFDPSGVAANQTLRWGFSGRTGYRWSAQLACVRSGAAGVVTRFVLDDKGTGKADVPALAECTSVVLIASNLSDGDYDVNFPDNSNAGDFTMTVEAVAAPALSKLTPAEVVRGSTDVAIEVQGEGFVDGPSLAASVSGGGVTVKKVAFVDATRLTLTADVEAGAGIGARDLTVTTGLGAQARLAGGLVVVDGAGVDAGADAEPGAGVQADSDGEGCACGASGSDSAGGVAGLALLGSMLAIFGRRTRR